MLTGRGYFVTAIIVFLTFAALGHFFGPNLIRFIDQTMGGARPLIGDMVSLVGEPLKAILKNPLIGSLFIAVVWPLGATLVALFIVMIVIAIGGGTVLDLGGTVQNMTLP